MQRFIIQFWVIKNLVLELAIKVQHSSNWRECHVDFNIYNIRRIRIFWKMYFEQVMISYEIKEHGLVPIPFKLKIFSSKYAMWCYLNVFCLEFVDVISKFLVWKGLLEFSHNSTTENLSNVYSESLFCESVGLKSNICTIWMCLRSMKAFHE